MAPALERTAVELLGKLTELKPASRTATEKTRRLLQSFAWGRVQVLAELGAWCVAKGMGRSTALLHLLCYPHPLHKVGAVALAAFSVFLTCTERSSRTGTDPLPLLFCQTLLHGMCGAPIPLLFIFLLMNHADMCFFQYFSRQQHCVSYERSSDI